MIPSTWNDDDIVISGISGRFPECESVEEFQEKLFAGEDLVTDAGRRWPPGMFGLPTRMGTIKNLEYFDTTFFGVTAKQADRMDPQMRIMLELTYEAIVDAGYNPAELRGTDTAVYVGVSVSESREFWNTDPETTHGYGLLGTSLAMLANRISYTFDFSGPSYPLDTACSSGVYALDQAFAAIKQGQCNAAIVGGTNLLLKPQNSLQFLTLNMLSPEGKCKSFEESGDGYVRSESVCIFFVQKVKDARRAYASIVGSRINNDGYKELGITFPNSAMQFKLIKELYDEVGIKPSSIDYVEAHGTGTRAGDPQELNPVFVDAFCENRQGPLLVGSVKSNMGHSEAASGLCGIAKIIIAMESGVIPQNLHFKNPNPDIPALLDGRIKIVAENLPWNGGYAGLNNFGFGGTNSHIILKSNPKNKVTQLYKNNIPNLFAVSGRTEEAVNTFINKLLYHVKNDELMALIHDVHKQNIPGHNYRGFILDGKTMQKEIAEISSEKRPIWFLYSGMGTQWNGIGQHMMKLDLFKETMDKCNNVLKPFGVDLIKILTDKDEKMFDNPMNSFLAITSTQIALTDILTKLGIKPDGIVGHSLGEIGCAYCDGTITLEQAILVSYYRGVVLNQENIVEGAMASVGLPWEECRKKCPPGIYLACYNNAENVTVSGLPAEIEKFVKQLQSENIFAKVVRTSKRAYHSKYVAPAEQQYLELLKSVIPNPKLRTSKWVSSSVPDSEWASSKSQLSSAEYHVNNLLSPVLFHQAIQHSPSNAIFIEISPSAIFLSILKKHNSPDGLNVGLMQSYNENNVNFFLYNLGKLYNAGVDMNLKPLYKPISYPVSRGTPMLQSMVQWDHSAKWVVASFTGKQGNAGESTISVDLNNENYSYISGHVIDGRVLFPGTGYLALVWKTFAKLHNEDYERTSVVFEQVKIHRATLMPKNNEVKFSINILEGTGQFEVSERGSVLLTGFIRTLDDTKKEFLELPQPVVKNDKELLNLKEKDIYTELNLRGYNYGKTFQGLYESDNFGQSGLIKWENNWVTFTDAMLQLSALRMLPRDMYLPISFEKVIIDPKMFLKSVDSLKEKAQPLHIPAYVHKDYNIVETNGIQIQGIKTTLAPRRQQTHPSPTHEKCEFIPYENNTLLDQNETEAQRQSIKVLTQTIIENSSSFHKINVAEIADKLPPKKLLAPLISDIIKFEVEYVDDYTIVSDEDADIYKSEFASYHFKISKNIASPNLHLLVVHDMFTKQKTNELVSLLPFLINDGMILSEETSNINENDINKVGLEVLSKHIINNKEYILLRKPIEIEQDNKVIYITNKNFKWVEPLANIMKNIENEKRVYLVAENEENSGIVGLATTLRREPGGLNIRVVFIKDKQSEKFSLSSPYYAKQLKKDLVYNVVQNGVWGTYRHLYLDNSTETETVLTEHAFVKLLTKGDLSSLKWIESPLKCHEQTNDVHETCSVYYSALNFRDVMLAVGKLSLDVLPENQRNQDDILGLEFSGMDKRGKRVMGIVKGAGIATSVVANKSLLWDVPKSWTLEEAATIPVAYATVYYALIVRGRMRPGESILIHSGAGAVGIAAITLAMHMGCTVFTTVSTKEKRSFLKEAFPKLQDSHIGNSRDTDFEKMVYIQTGGRGVDLVLNSLTDEKLQASIRCLAKHGRFLEIGKNHASNYNLHEMGFFLKNCSFHEVILDVLIGAESLETNEISKLMADGIKNGVVRPLPRSIYSDSQVEEAFRFITVGKHIGKVLIKIRDESNSKTTKKLIPALPRTYFHPNKTYIVVGGLGGFAMELTYWLISRGAKKIILVTRSGVKTGYQSLCVRKWTEMGATIKISTADLTNESAAKKFLEEANKLGPIAGIFNLAAVLQDAIMANQTEEKFKLCWSPKAEIIKVLDKLTRVLCPDLEYFVSWSSLSCGRGNEGQSSYSYAISSMERICEARKRDGFPSLVYQTSCIADVGLTMALTKSNEAIVRGTHLQSIPSCLQTIDKFLHLQNKSPILCTMVVADKRRDINTSNEISPLEAVANILGIKDVKNAPQTTSFSNLGMDSLMGDEVKQTLERNYFIVLKSHEIRALTFESLKKLATPSTN